MNSVQRIIGAILLCLGIVYGVLLLLRAMRERSAFLEEKGSFLDELNKLDEGFDGLYKKLESELMSSQAEYADEISDMKSLIRERTAVLE